MVELFHNVSFKTSRLITNQYSTSFSIGVRCLHPSIRNAVYSIYGFVRLADEIVDSFHDHDKKALLEEFEKEYYKAREAGISLNPVINSFIHTVKKYSIDDELVRAFLKSMEKDLYTQEYGYDEFKEYIYGSADVVGLMCLKVFVKGDEKEYRKLRPYAMRLGSAFQKINFLRDMSEDISVLQRKYFPVLRTESLNEKTKKIILDEIMEDYNEALKGIRQLPDCARLGVYTAYLYYLSLTKYISKTTADQLFTKRARVPGMQKFLLLCKAWVSTKLN